MKHLQERLKKDANAGLVDADRLENLSSIITEFGHLLGPDSDHVGALMARVDGMQDRMEGVQIAGVRPIDLIHIM
jgi:hypothetical protein